MAAYHQIKPAGVMDTMHSAIAAVYAGGLLDCIRSDAEADEIARELTELAVLIGNTTGARELLVTSLLSSPERCELVSRIFSGRVSSPIEALLAVMARRDRLDVLEAVPHEFRRLLDARLGKIEVSVRTAFKMDDSLRDSLVAELSQTLGRPVVLRATVDRDIIGGAVVKVGDRVYDGSVAARLKSMARALSEKLTG